MRLIVWLCILFTVLASTTVLAQDKLPPLNASVIRYVESVIGQQVDRGECWDLANQALTRISADWNREFVYGKKLDPGKEKIYPGDLIQFRNVRVRYQQGNTIITESYMQHTAIVYRVHKPGVYELAHQNTDFSGRKVGISTFHTDHVIAGKMFFYRPLKK